MELLNIFHVMFLPPRAPHLLHGLFFLLKLVAVMPQLVHYLPVEVHLIFQPQTSVLQLVCHPLLLLERKKDIAKHTELKNNSALIQFGSDFFLVLHISCTKTILIKVFADIWEHSDNTSVCKLSSMFTELANYNVIISYTHLVQFLSLRLESANIQLHFSILLF